MPKDSSMLIGSIVLAGGASSRMGRPKASLPFQGGTLLGRTVDLLLESTFPVVVVASGPEQELPPLPLESDLVHDATPGEGPLAALCDGLQFLQGKCDAAFVTGCDLPFLRGDFVDWLAQQIGAHQIVVPENPAAAGKPQPLAGLYRVDVLPQARALLATGKRSLQALLDACHTRVLPATALVAIDPSGRMLQSVNTPQEYDDAMRSAQG